MKTKQQGLNPTTFSSVETTESLGEDGWVEHKSLPQVIFIIIVTLIILMLMIVESVHKGCRAGYASNLQT